MFIKPMWTHETERLGLSGCSPLGGVVRAISELLGWCGGLMLFVFPVVMVSEWLRGTIHSGLWGLLLMPWITGGVSLLLFHLALWLVDRRGFGYDRGRDLATWMDAGTPQTFRYEDSGKTTAQTHLPDQSSERDNHEPQRALDVVLERPVCPPGTPSPTPPRSPRRQSCCTPTGFARTLSG